MIWLNTNSLVFGSDAIMYVGIVEAAGSLVMHSVNNRDDGAPLKFIQDYYNLLIW